MNIARKEPTYPGLIDILWPNGPRATRFNLSALILWVPCPCRTVTNTYFFDYDFPKWYEAFPCPDQTAYRTTTALPQNWICQFGCPHSIHSDQGRNFGLKFFESLTQALHVGKTRATAFRPQSNAVVERMNPTLQSMLSKCINDEQRN